MTRFTKVELIQLDQLLKEMNSENTHQSSDVAWNIWKSYTMLKLNHCIAKKDLIFHKKAKLTLTKFN